ncbi:A/G-specific adenine glycosylase [Clavibacter tessellarius]
MPETALARDVNAWFRENARDLPWRRDGFGSWGILVSEFMLQQTPVVRVIPRLEEWLVRWPTPAALGSTPASEAVRAWGRLGYPRRALNLHACAVAITERHGGEVPEDVDALLDLPGVGPYTARAVAAFAFGHRHPVVDVNVRRVLARAVAGQGDPGPARTAVDLAAMEAQLPADVAEARVFNAGTMETRRGRLHGTGAPLRGVPDPGPVRVAGGRVPGVRRTGARSAEEVRGIRQAGARPPARRAAVEPLPVSAADLATAWPEPVQRDRALAGLVADGLAVVQPDGTYALPS